MASLRQVVADHRDEITNGVAWLAVYKDGRSWEAQVFYPEAGDYEDGYVFSDEDYNELVRIADLDHKAICINGYYMGGLEDFSLSELEDKIFYFHEFHHHTLRLDFLGGFVVPPEGKQASVDALLASAADKVESTIFNAAKTDISFDKE